MIPWIIWGSGKEIFLTWQWKWITQNDAQCSTSFVDPTLKRSRSLSLSVFQHLLLQIWGWNLRSFGDSRSHKAQLNVLQATSCFLNHKGGGDYRCNQRNSETYLILSLSIIIWFSLCFHFFHFGDITSLHFGSASGYIQCLWIFPGALDIFLLRTKILTQLN